MGWHSCCGYVNIVISSSTDILYHDGVSNVLFLVLFTGVLVSAVLVGLLFDGGQEPVSRKIRAGLIVGGIAIALLGTVAGCGVAALLKIPFNVASVQVLPYLAMALVSQVLYILLYSQLNTGADAKTTLKKYGFSLLLGILVASTFIATGAVFPIPAVRSLALQVCKDNDNDMY